MNWSDREQALFEEVKEWEEQLLHYETNDLETTYDRLLEELMNSVPQEWQDKMFQHIDGWLFHLHSLLQGSQMQHDARESILSTARAFDPNVKTINDLSYLPVDQLRYIAEQHAGRHRLYSFIQGGITGTGGKFVLGADIPTMVVLNLRSIQLISMSYGYDVQTPFEMMISLKVFHAATLPARLRQYAWEDLIEDLTYQDNRYFYHGEESLTDYTWAEGPLKQVLKGIIISMFRKKKLGGVPVISVAIGAGVNYQLSRRVTDFAEKFYQYRYLNDKQVFKEE
ncbi:ABC transporter substrate-binding protein [Bacillus coahuilensis m2-6]|uniref:ABC transporter substrate-binding protein n=1 Tax=Bacillus coahuilensis p1.1.43 TaxID=1150625 RepID=A0A147K6J5_9BACI|nr:EcsC family protein [Bacillus coahuilensis]KUP05487.1 ABC transporter substrate-binding protein [Bacillus coahuilensis p1.1.43]KUP06675.1 ABC transporter substrate-binding protein [Bacillus coahuilensis m2-6]